MSFKQDLQALQNTLDKKRNTLVAAEKRFNQVLVGQTKRDIESINKQISALKQAKASDVSSKCAQLKAMKFHRALLKEEQADMGKLKKSVKGLVVVHPLTALGQEMGVSEVTGYARKAF